jgi:hypothetical protein
MYVSYFSRFAEGFDSRYSCRRSARANPIQLNEHD